MHTYAHSHPAHPHPADAGTWWEPLFTPFGEGTGETRCSKRSCLHCSNLEASHGHLNKAAFQTAKFASEMFAEDSPEAQIAWEWGYATGLWHDLGKFSRKWQDYLAAKANPSGGACEKVDHSTPGAKHAARQQPQLGQLIAFAIAGHHSGLLDAESNGACLAARFKNESEVPETEVHQDVLTYPFPPSPRFLRYDAFALNLFTRMLFSCLVDADFLTTEAFMNPDQAGLRNQVPIHALETIRKCFDAHIDSFPIPAPSDFVNCQRRKVVEDCRQAAPLKPGIFTLTVPTGGGKTLAAMTFALRHAIAHGKKRIICVVPFTSIIEQNADVYRQVLASLVTESFTPVIEHHASLNPENEDDQSRLAAENWDAPIIVTTAVQFYESLFAAKTSRCRKLHNIANAVVILDEAQTLPVDFLSPCLAALSELSITCRTSIVLCTATQPAIRHEKELFPIGLRETREIIQNPPALFNALKRVNVVCVGKIDDTALASRIDAHDRVLCIVNRREHARKMFCLLKKNEDNHHLSALMCPEHRSQVLKTIRSRLAENRPARVISTQLVEAGVDLDFPIVFRAMAGLDSIGQAAGRCNRNGTLTGHGTTFVFEPDDDRAETYFRETAQVTKRLLGTHEDLLSAHAVADYFNLYYYQQRPRWDSREILGDFRLDAHRPQLPFHFQYKSAASRFRLIDDNQQTILIPFDSRARELIHELESNFAPLNRTLLRSLQRYVVQIPKHLFTQNLRAFKSIRDDQFHVLLSPELNYSFHFGLTFDRSHTSSQPCIC